MRIISGKYKGRRLVAPKKLPVRPTTDMCKESLFNILNNYFNLHGLKVLDLFSGTGNISYEFASRGAGPITSIDGNMGCVNFIKKTALELDLDISVIKSDVFKFLEKSKATYDIIFADPPYDIGQENFEKIIQEIFKNELLDEDGMLIVEHSKHTLLNHMTNFSFSKSYGGSVFSFYEFDDEEEEENIEEEDED
jgi:16S rRNA (guanine966-N2)-methyltransferase